MAQNTHYWKIEVILLLLDKGADVNDHGEGMAIYYELRHYMAGYKVFSYIKEPILMLRWIRVAGCSIW